MIAHGINDNNYDHDHEAVNDDDDQDSSASDDQLDFHHLNMETMSL
jgi:hypothetical protein